MTITINRKLDTLADGLFRVLTAMNVTDDPMEIRGAHIVAENLMMKAPARAMEDTRIDGIMTAIDLRYHDTLAG